MIKTCLLDLSLGLWFVVLSPWHPVILSQVNDIHHEDNCLMFLHNLLHFLEVFVQLRLTQGKYYEYMIGIKTLTAI